jgi:uncharacterized membrane protein YccC
MAEEAKVKHRRPREKRQLPAIDAQRLREFVPSRRQAVDIVIGSALVLGCLGILFRLRELGRQAKALASDGTHVFSPGQLVSDQAWFALRMTLISLVVIVAVALIARKRSATIVLTIVFGVICLSAVVTVFATFQQYRGFLHG